MKDGIKELERKIENALLKLSLNSEFKDNAKFLEEEYLKIKKDVSKITDDFELTEYYASLLTFEEAYISYAVNLVSNKKAGKSIYDTTDIELDEKISSKEKTLEEIIKNLKDKFPIIGDILEKEFDNLKNEYTKNLKESIEQSKYNSDFYLGLTDTVKLYFVTLDSTKKYYLNNLQIFDEFFLYRIKKILDKNLQIYEKHKLLTNRINVFKNNPNYIKFLSKLNLLLEEYKDKCEHIQKNGSLDYIVVKIEEIQNDYINRLKQIEKNINDLLLEKEKIKYGKKLLDYFNNIIADDINYEKILEIESYFISNNLSTNNFYNKLYILIEYELVRYGKSKIYEIISPISKLAIEKMFFNKTSEISSNDAEIAYRHSKGEFHIEILLDFISNIDELKQYFIYELKQNYFSKLKNYHVRKIENEVPEYYKNDMSKLYVIKDNGLYGYIDSNHIIVIPCKYKNADDFSNGLARVQNSEGLWGFIDEAGIEVIPCKYKNADDFSNGLARVQNSEGLWGFIDETGIKVIPCQYNSLCNFSEGLAAVQNSEGLCGFIDETGIEVIPCQYEQFAYFSDGLAHIFRHLNENEYIDKTGKKVISSGHLFAYNFMNGLALVRNDEHLYGYIDKTGKEVIPCQYKEADDFSGELAAVKNSEELWGFIDKTGKKVTPFKYTFIFPESEDGLFIVINKKDLYGIVNKEGKEVVPCKYGLIYLIGRMKYMIRDNMYRFYELEKSIINLNEFSQKIKYKEKEYDNAISM